MRVVRSGDNPAVKAARKLQRARTRTQTGRLLVEGPRVVAQVLAQVERLFVTEDAAERYPSLVAGAAHHEADVVVVSDELLASIADTGSPQGVVGVARKPQWSLADTLEHASLVVVLTEPAEPGNVGTVIRTATAAGADAVILIQPAVDPTNPKTVRASAGSLFNLPVISGDWAAVRSALTAGRMRLIGADGDGTQAHWDADLSGPCALLFGSEVHGLPAVVADACDVLVRVPMAPDVESLNLAAAAAVCTYEAARQRTHAHTSISPVAS